MTTLSGTPLRRRRRYPSDLTDRLWDHVSKLMPEEARRGRHRQTDLREIVNGIQYRWTTGCTWRMLPHDFPPWGTVYSYFRRWSRDGTLRPLRETLLRTPHARDAAVAPAPSEPAAA